MSELPHFVIIEDSANDVQEACQTLKTLGVESPMVFRDVKRALLYLEEIVDGIIQCPDVIVLDLEFGGDSGFEVLRFYKSHRQLSQCNIVIWTVMGELEQELAKLFQVEAVVSKSEGIDALRLVLVDILHGLSSAQSV
jgi:CheY-like chemotaxis protein